AEHAMRAGGIVSKEENDLLVQWAIKAKETFQELTGRKDQYTAEAEDEVGVITRAWDLFQSLEPRMSVSDEQLFRKLQDLFGTAEPYGFGVYFQGGMGAAAMRELLRQVDPVKEVAKLREEIRTGKGQKQQ